MEPHQQALYQGGELLKMRQQVDALFEQIQDQQVQQEQQLQGLLATGNTKLKGKQAIGEMETLIHQLKKTLTTEGKGVVGLSYGQMEQLILDVDQKIKQAEMGTRQELHNALQQAATALLQSLELTGTVNQLNSLGQTAQGCLEQIEQFVQEHQGYPGQEGADEN